MYAKIVSFGEPGFPEACLDETAQFLVVIDRIKESPAVSSTGKTLSIIGGCRNQKVVSEPYGPAVQSHGDDIVVSFSAYIPNPDAPKTEPTLSRKQQSVLAEAQEQLKNAAAGQSQANPLMQQVASILAQQLSGGMK